MKKTILICLTLTLSIFSFAFQASDTDENIVFEKSTDAYSLKLSEVAENENEISHGNDQYLFLEQSEKGYEVYFANLNQLFSFCLDVDYYQISTAYQSNKIYLLEYNTKDRNQTDQLVVKDLLKHFGLEMKQNTEKKKVHFLTVNSQKEFGAYISNEEKPFSMQLMDGFYNFTNFTMRSAAKIIDHAIPDHNIASGISENTQYTFKLKKCTTLDDLKANLENLGLTLIEKEVATEMYSLKIIE